MNDDFPDDDLPITKEWLSGLKLKVVKASEPWKSYMAMPTFEIDDKGVLWIAFSVRRDYADLPLPVIKTRGQLRVLLLLLGFAE